MVKTNIISRKTQDCPKCKKPMIIYEHKEDDKIVLKTIHKPCGLPKVE